MLSSNGANPRDRTSQCLATAALMAAAVGAIILTAPVANATPFGDGCIATHGRGYVNVQAQLEQCFWMDEATGNEHMESELLPPNPKNPPPTVQNPGLSPRG
jgi:hypothetical protein